MESQKIKTSKKPAMIVFTSIVVSIIVLFASILGMAKLAGLKIPPSEAKNGERHLPVEVLQVEKKDFPIYITGYGEVKALNVVPIAPEVAGKIIKIHPRLEAGEIVSKGEVLFKIDPTDYLTTLKTGRERLKILKRSQELAKIEYERTRRLYQKNKVGTLVGVETAEKKILSAADLTSQVAQVLQTAETNLKRCEVRASFDARIKRDKKFSIFTAGGRHVLFGEDTG